MKKMSCMLFCAYLSSTAVFGYNTTETREKVRQAAWLLVPWAFGVGFSDSGDTLKGAQMPGYFSAGYQNPALGIANLAVMRMALGDGKAGLAATYIASDIAAGYTAEKLGVSPSTGHGIMAAAGMTALYLPKVSILPELQSYMGGYTIVGSVASGTQSYLLEQGYSLDRARLMTGAALLSGSLIAKGRENDAVAAAMALESGFRMIPTLMNVYGLSCLSMIPAVPLMVYFSKLGTRQEGGLVRHNFLKATGQALFGALLVSTMNGWVNSMFSSSSP